MPIKALLLSLVMSLVSFLSAHAQETVPPDLQPWVSWVKGRHPEWACARVKDSFECLWPGKLSLALKKGGADFTLGLEVFKEAAVSLPGSSDLLPAAIQVVSDKGETKSYPVLMQEGLPVVILPPGRYQIQGSFVWAQAPRELKIPAFYGLVQVGSDSNLLEAARLSRSGMLWLSSQKERELDDALTLSVARKISDGSPLKLETRIDLKVSGNVRSLDFGKILPDEVTPVQVISALPYQLSAEGQLVLQVRPGDFSVNVVAISQPKLEALSAPKPGSAAWPKEETWAWFPDNQFRSVEISGAAAVQAQNTSLPEEWQSEAAYLLSSGQTMHLKELRRGEINPQANALNVRRKLWLDLDGRGFTAVDQVSGEIYQGWRLNALPGMLLSNVQSEGQPQLITLDPGTKQAGVELRSQALNLEAVSRMQRSVALYASGWAGTLRGLYTELNLPPGWKFLHASGVDSVQGSWLSSWTLLDLFLMILMALASLKLFGRLPAGLVLASLLLNHTEFLAPRLLLAHVIIAFALEKLIENKETFWARAGLWYARLTFGVWFLALLSFSKLQVTQLLFPQLQAGTRYRTVLQELLNVEESNFFVCPLVLIGLLLMCWCLYRVITQPGFWRRLLALILSAVVAWLMLFIVGGFVAFTAGSRVNEQFSKPSEYGSGQVARKMYDKEGYDWEEYKTRDQNTLQQTIAKLSPVQTGAAKPSWSWKRYGLSWNGQVAANHQMRLYLLSPFWTRALSAVRVVLLLLLVFVLLGNLKISMPRLPKEALLLVLLLLLPRGANAQFPSDGILKELETRLLEKRCNAKECSGIAGLNLTMDGQRLTIEAQASSRGLGAVALPGPLENMAVDQVLVDGQESIAMRRDESGFLWVKVPDGQSQVRLSARVLSDSVLTLQFPMQPMHVAVTPGVWNVEGLSKSGIVRDSLRLVRESKGSAQSFKAVDLPAWLVLKRSINIGHEIRVNTVAQRVGDKRNPLSVKLPLIATEKVTSDGVLAQGLEVAVRFAEGQETVSWSSVLNSGPELDLQAGARPYLSEIWEVSCSALVRCTPSGLTFTSSLSGGRQVFTWKPFPAEKVKVAMRPVVAAGGENLTLDRVGYEVTWGSRILGGKLTLGLRNTAQRQFSLELPQGARVSSSKLNGQEARYLANGNGISFVLNPGEHELVLDYDLSWAPSTFEAVPPLKLGAPAHNVAISVYPARRWILWLGGLSWGPAVLFWSKLLFLIIFAVALAKFKLVSLRAASAVILAFGMATLPIIWILVPLIWLIFINFVPKIKEFKFSVGLKLTVFVLLSLAALLVFYEAVRRGLIVDPPMLIAGNSSSSQALYWYLDHGAEALPQPWVISLPMWCWRALMLAWSAWLAALVFLWVKQGISALKELKG